VTVTAPTSIPLHQPAAMELTAAGVTLGYPGTTVLSGLDLRVAPGEILIVFGHSGCGKSTLLRGLAGLLAPGAGRILADGAPVTGTSPDRAVIFQDDALLPWRSAQRNVELPLAIRGVPRTQRRQRAGHWLATVGLAGQEHRLPRELSGGMRQRVQLARTLAGCPRAILADEPFGALDAQTRGAMQRLLIGAWKAQPTTIVFVTHDVDEALFLGDRVAVLRPGGIERTLPVPHPRDAQARSAPAVKAARASLLAALDGTPAALPPRGKNPPRPSAAGAPVTGDGGYANGAVRGNP
jgi:NitT/TauT family transport system ATP-binding protein